MIFKIFFERYFHGELDFDHICQFIHTDALILKSNIREKN